MKLLRSFFYFFIALTGMLLVAFLIMRTPDLPLEELEKDYTNENSQFVDIDGASVHYRVEGTGKPVLLIHGTSSSLHTWDAWTDNLQTTYQVIRLDLPGFGLTGHVPDVDYQIEYYVEFLNKFLDKIGIKKTSIAGNSLGGEIAWNYTLQYPDRVDKLILIDPAGVPSAETPAIFKLAKNPITGLLLKHITPKRLIKDNILEVYANDSLVTESLVQRYYDMVLSAGNRDAFVARANNHGNRDKIDDLMKIKHPTLIQWGRDDIWIPVTDAYIFNEKIENSSLHIYDNSGHVPMEESPKSTVADAIAFLDK